MNLLTFWLNKLCNDCNFKVKFKPLNKEAYRDRWEQINQSINPIKPPEFFIKNVDLEEFEKELEVMYIEVMLDNAGYKQPHEFLLSGVSCLNDRYFLYFSSEYTNWPIKRIVVFNLDSNIIRNDFKRIYKRSWKDFKENKYQPKKKKTLASVPEGFKRTRPVITIDEE